ncbi:MAG: hypothetical protein R3297_06910 [Desulfobulbales bacterium]|nr:hypothetical protein [Desulfobulbales bacterium]
MNVFINIIGAVLLGLFAYFIFKGRTKAKRTNDYFCNAVRVYALTEEEDARVAILTAAKAAAKKQRHSMVKYLQSMASDMEKVSKEKTEIKSHIDAFIKSSRDLVEEISLQEWSSSDIINQKKELENINPQYLIALEKVDPTIFAQKHPELFK